VMEKTPLWILEALLGLLLGAFLIVVWGLS
jgi:hypothetical protein